MFSGRPRGFGFVTMKSKEATEAAIQALNGKQVDGRAMHYNFARVHQTLRITPAMAAGVSDHVWSLEEIVGLLK